MGLDFPGARLPGKADRDGDEPASDGAASDSSGLRLRPNPNPQLPVKLARRLVADGPAPAPAPSPRPARELDDVVAGEAVATMELRERPNEYDVVRRR